MIGAADRERRRRTGSTGRVGAAIGAIVVLVACRSTPSSLGETGTPVAGASSIAAAPSIAASSPTAAAPVELVTRAEIEALPDDVFSSRGASPGDPDGPIIELESPPESGVHAAPIAIRVRFRPGPLGHAVDPGSLRVEYKKAWGFDITDRVREFLSASGIDIERAMLPSGRHTVEVEIADVAARVSRRLFSVTVE